MLDWRGFSLLCHLMRFGPRNAETMDTLACEDRDEPQLDLCEADIPELRTKQEALLAGIAQTLRRSNIKPYRALVSRLIASSHGPIS